MQFRDSECMADKMMSGLYPGSTALHVFALRCSLRQEISARAQLSEFQRP
jgi:hypothetical protein